MIVIFKNNKKITKLCKPILAQTFKRTMWNHGKQNKNLIQTFFSKMNLINKYTNLFSKTLFLFNKKQLSSSKCTKVIQKEKGSFIQMPKQILLPKFEKIEEPKEIKTYSGLINFSPEFITGNIIYKQEFHTIIILNYLKIFYILGKYEIDNDEKLILNLFRLMTSLSELYLGMIYFDKWVSMTMSLTQHILRALFLDKKIPIELIDKYMEGDVDYTQYKTGDILLLIESFIGKNTLKGLLKQISYTAMNPDYPEELRYQYSKLESKKATGQDNPDWQGDRALVSPDGMILFAKKYNDSKTFSSGIKKGRLNVGSGCDNPITNPKKSYFKLTLFYFINKIYSKQTSYLELLQIINE